MVFHGLGSGCKEEQKWSIEKPQLDNARSLRGIYLIDTADSEFKETIQNARRKLEVLMHSPTPLQEDSTRDDEEAESDYWTVIGDFIYRHHVEPRVKLYMPREEAFPFPRKYIDVARTTDTTLDVMSEKHIEDYWNVDVDRELSDAWTGFTRFIVLNEKKRDVFSWCSNWPRLEADSCLHLLHLICVFLVFLMKCCSGFSLKPARPMCDGRPFASPLFRRHSGRGPFFSRFPCPMGSTVCVLFASLPDLTGRNTLLRGGSSA